jgi:predicted kinase
MPAKLPTIYVIAGCNGAGKTTFAKEFLPKEVKCLRFLNADEIARGLSPLKPSAGAVRAARLLLTQVDECLRRRETFALETTLSGKTYIRRFRRARELGYEVELHYLWLSSPAASEAGRASRSRNRHSPPVQAQPRSPARRLSAVGDALGGVGQPQPARQTARHFVRPRY